MAHILESHLVTLCIAVSTFGYLLASLTTLMSGYLFYLLSCIGQDFPHISWDIFSHTSLLPGSTFTTGWLWELATQFTFTDFKLNSQGFFLFQMLPNLPVETSLFKNCFKFRVFSRLLFIASNYFSALTWIKISNTLMGTLNLASLSSPVAVATSLSSKALTEHNSFCLFFYSQLVYRNPQNERASFPLYVMWSKAIYV